MLSVKLYNSLNVGHLLYRYSEFGDKDVFEHIHAIVKFLVTELKVLEPDSLKTQRCLKIVPNKTYKVSHNGPINVVHNIYPSSRGSEKVGKGKNKKVKAGLSLQLAGKDCRWVADYNITFESDSDRQAFKKRLTIINELASHPNLEGMQKIGAYQCQHGKSKLRAIAPLYDFCLREKLEEEEKELSWDFCVRCVWDVSKGLGHLHDQGYCHRDLTRSNIVGLKGGKFVIIDLDNILGENGKWEKYAGSAWSTPWVLFYANKVESRVWDIFALAKIFYFVLKKAPNRSSEVDQYLNDVMESANKDEYTHPREICDKVLEKILLMEEPRESIKAIIRSLSDME